MLDNEEKQASQQSGEKDDGCEFTKALHNRLVAGKTVGVAGIVRRVVGSYDG